MICHDDVNTMEHLFPDGTERIFFLIRSLKHRTMQSRSPLSIRLSPNNSRELRAETEKVQHIEKQERVMLTSPALTFQLSVHSKWITHCLLSQESKPPHRSAQCHREEKKANGSGSTATTNINIEVDISTGCLFLH